ncbi:hypothetical protein ACNAN0_10950 [Agrilactobacillus fermenti]|uniref:hypothetical protein n=1 Tax=Agrilactobacillus fermenti TaxID=2586909 RepID=UPI003A5C6190
MVYPDKVKSYGEQISRGYKGIVVSGVVTNWHEHARSANNEVLTEYDLLVNKQLTYKSNQNLEGTTIKVLHPGGYTTVGEQMDVMPEKSFAPKPQLTEAERQKVTFVESISEPLPRIGDQIFVALVPNEREANLDFYNKGIFSKTDTFSLAAGANCYFFFNEKTGKYESKVIDPQSGQLKANDLSVGEETTYKNAQRAMLDDVNQNYQETSVSE